MKKYNVCYILPIYGQFGKLRDEFKTIDVHAYTPEGAFEIARLEVEKTLPKNVIVRIEHVSFFPVGV